MLLSLVMPCFNEGENVQPMHAAVMEAFAGCGYDYEMVFVDDGSRDDTYAKLKQLHAEHNNVRVVRFSRNFGKESAIYAGLQHARGDFVCIIDADLQQPPALVREMVVFLELNADCDCVAAYQQVRSDGRVLKFFKNNFYRIMNRVTEIEFVQGASDFRTMRRSMVDAIVSLGEQNRFAKGIFSWVGFATHYVPYTAAARHAGTTKWNKRSLFRYAFDGIISFSTMPLRLASFAGVLSALGALIYGLVVIIQRLFWGVAVPGFATLAVLILFLGGLQLLGLGLIGEYLAKTYTETKARPIYVTKEVLEPKDD
ncbi:MAG: glycosyltransferase family 2 protein [Oscillospiraceae bacterium]|nr:glycosyltransferase family 2 protein [Oscillospiraceae bacterium]